MHPTSDLPLYVLEPPPRRAKIDETGEAAPPKRDPWRNQALPPGTPPSAFTTRGWTSLEVIHHALLEPLDARDRFDRWWRGAPHELRVGHSVLRLDETRVPDFTMRLVRGRAYLHRLPLSIPVEMELAAWGRRHAAMYLRPTNKFLLASSARRRRVWFALGHGAVDQIRDAMLAASA